MPRRRVTLADYVRRRWRVVGAIVVLLLGALLVVGVTDRGHDPLWKTAGTDLDQAAITPDASATYLLRRDQGNISGLAAYAGADGTLLWEGRLNATRALLAAGSSGVAVATDFPLAFLTVYGPEGSIRWALPLQGNPVALAVSGERVALALNAPTNPVLLFEGDLQVQTLAHASPVRALDLRAGFVATGGLAGEVIVREFAGREVLNTTLGMSLRSVQLSDDGTVLVAGGFGATPADPRGHVAFLDIGADEPLRWERETPVGVGLVDTDSAALLVLAVEEAPQGATLHVYDGATGATRWTRRLDGSVARDNAGVSGGAAIAPDATTLVAATLRGDIQAYDARSGDALWTYRAAGASVVAYADEEPHRLVAGARLLQTRPYDALLVFSTSQEPLAASTGLVALGLVLLAATTLAVGLGAGYWRARRTY